MPASCHVAIFSKPPIPGEVKTRLIPALGAGRAAALHRRLLEHTLHTVCNAGYPRSLWIAGDPAHPALRDAGREFGIALRKQRGVDLGARMKHAMRALLAEAKHVAIIGTDCPVLDASHLARAFDALRDGAEVTAIPAEDGGYVLIGMASAEPSRRDAMLDVLFDDMPWSTDEVMARTRERLARLPARWHELPALWDIDRPEDLARLDALSFDFGIARP